MLFKTCKNECLEQSLKYQSNWLFFSLQDTPFHRNCPQSFSPVGHHCPQVSEDCNMANLSRYLGWLLPPATACAKEEDRCTMLFESCCICCQCALSSVLPEGALWVMLPPPDMCRALLGRNAEQQYLHTDLLILTRESQVFSSSWKAANTNVIQRCTKTFTVCKHACGSPNCGFFPVKSFSRVKQFICLTVEVIGCQRLSCLQELLWR